MAVGLGDLGAISEVCDLVQAMEVQHGVQGFTSVLTLALPVEETCAPGCHWLVGVCLEVSAKTLLPGRLDVRGGALPSWDMAISRCWPEIASSQSVLLLSRTAAASLLRSRARGTLVPERSLEMA